MTQISIGIDDLGQVVVLKKEFNRIRIAHQDTNLKGVGNLVSCHKKVNIVLGIPDENVVQKQIQLDKQLCELAIEDIIVREAEKIFEFPYVDFHIDGINEDNDQKIDISFVIGNQIAIDKKVNVIEKQGLAINAVDIYSAAIARVERCKEDMAVKEGFLVPTGLALKNTT